MSALRPHPLDTAALAVALEAVGDRWSLAILQAIATGAHRFTELQVSTAAPRASLTSHLRQLEQRGLIRRARYQVTPNRWEYRLTDCGAAVIPQACALADWAAKYFPSPAHRTDLSRGAE